MNFILANRGGESWSRSAPCPQRGKKREKKKRGKKSTTIPFLVRKNSVPLVARQSPNSPDSPLDPYSLVNTSDVLTKSETTVQVSRYFVSRPTTRENQGEQERFFGSRLIEQLRKIRAREGSRRLEEEQTSRQKGSAIYRPN